MICLEIDYFKGRIVQLFIMSKSMETDAELLVHGKHSNMACCLSNYGMQLSCIIKITVLIINIIWSTSFAIFSQYIQKQNASRQSNIAFVIQNLSAKGEHKNICTA